MATMRTQGELHPNKPYYWETSANGGKGDWRNLPKSGNIPGTNTPVPSGSKQPSSNASGKVLTDEQLEFWAKTAKESSLLVIANNPKGRAMSRKIAYDALEERGYDMSKVDTSGTLDALNKMISGGSKPQTNGAGSTEDDLGISIPAGGNVVINGKGVDGHEITEKWYLNKKDARVKKLFNLDTKEGRIKYDQFVYKQKIKEKDYTPPSEVITRLNMQYASFLKNDKKRFMISAGGAGIGKSYGFKGLATLLNKKPFEEGDIAGESDYDYFEAPDVSSGKQLLNILKAHNGKIILFDDNDKVLTRADCSSVMKKATSATGKRIVGDPDDVKTNFEFTGRIMIMTNKDLSTLAENEDTKAIISRAMQVSEIYLTVPETIEVLEDRFQDMEFEEVERLDDQNEDEKEREEVFDIIKKNQKNIDPRHFTTRTFQEALNAKRDIDDSNELSKNSAFQKFLGSKQRDWKDNVTAIITKADDNDVDYFEKSDDLGNVNKNDIKTYEDILKAHENDFLISEDFDIEKAELLLFGEEK